MSNTEIEQLEQAWKEWEQTTADLKQGYRNGINCWIPIEPVETYWDRYKERTDRLTRLQERNFRCFFKVGSLFDNYKERSLKLLHDTFTNNCLAKLKKVFISTKTDIPLHFQILFDHSHIEVIRQQKDLRPISAWWQYIESTTDRQMFWYSTLQQELKRYEVDYEKNDLFYNFRPINGFLQLGVVHDL